MVCACLGIMLGQCSTVGRRSEGALQKDVTIAEPLGVQKSGGAADRETRQSPEYVYMTYTYANFEKVEVDHD